MSARTARAALAGLAGLVAAALAGCATGPNANPKDPLEPFNRAMYAFNDKLDTYALKPVAKGYQAVVPQPVRSSVHNFFGNFSDAWSTVNELLVGNFDDTARMTMRVLTNTIIGLGGLLDPASEMGLERKQKDLGQTLGRWGVPSGPYLVLPLFGPSDVRDAVALPADTWVAPALLVSGTGPKLGVDALGVVDTRANLLSASQMLNDIALDPYTFLRDAYLTRRRSLIYDGNPPEEPQAPDEDGQAAPAPASAASAARLAAPSASAASATPAASATSAASAR